MYGPQPGGALNYVTHRPRTDQPFSARTQQIFGSDNLYSTFNSVDGTVGRVGYYGFFNYRTGDGFREANSDFDVFAGSAKLVLDADSDSRWIFSFDGYAEEHGEPGGLAFGVGPDYNVNREATTRFFDRFELERYFGSLGWERDFSENTQLTVTGWGGYYSRSTNGSAVAGSERRHRSRGQQQHHRASGILHHGDRVTVAARLDQREPDPHPGRRPAVLSHRLAAHGPTGGQA